MKFKDEQEYRFHKKDISSRCFCCSNNSQALLIVRHMESKMLVHLCPDCMVNNMTEYLLDNTRPWIGKKPK